MASLGAIVFRFSLALIILLSAFAGQAKAFTADELQLEFDARLLTGDEKRFLQTGLAFADTYNGLIDGAWGSGSQRALENYEVKNGRSAFVTNADVLFLAIETYTLVEERGWVRQYNGALDMSFLVPTLGFVSGAPSENFANMQLSGTTLRYSFTIADEQKTVRLHEYTAGKALGEIYQVRQPLVWITSARDINGESLYTRSDYRRGSWSTILLSAHDADSGIFAAVTGSIVKGYAPPIDISHGVLERGIGVVAQILDDNSKANSETKPAGSASTSDSSPADNGGTDEQEVRFGTGFLVSSNGDFLTNSHVVNGCQSVSIEGVSAKIVAQDTSFDLALLHVSETTGKSPARFAQKPARLNSDVTVLGYPLPDLLGGLNVTRGSVTSLKGLGGDAVRMQISAPVQPGNSGGPVVNAAGQIVGVVVSKLDAQMVANATGDIPQNINFAIRAEIAKLFLYQNGVEPIDAEDAVALPPEELAEVARGFTRLVTCN